MKSTIFKNLLTILSIFLIHNISNPVFGQSSQISKTIEVSGNCKMCKKQIEKAGKLKGVSDINWDIKSHLLTISYDSLKTSIDKIQLRIAAVGYDTPLFKANEETYNKLHTCCQYPRKKE